MKKVFISMLSIFFIVSMITTVNAATGSINLGASADTVVQGKTFTVTVVGTASDNITAMQGNLTYDANKLKIETKSAGNGFSDLSGSGEIAISATSSENLSKTGTLYTITFKVLDTATTGATTISVKNAVLALVNDQATQENTPESSDEVTITIKEDDTTIGNQGGENTPDGSEDENDQGENNPSNDNENNNNNNNDNSGNNGGNADEEENKDTDVNGNTNTDKNNNTNTNNNNTNSNNTNTNNNNINSNNTNTNKNNTNTSKNTSTNTNKNTNKNTTRLPQTGAESTGLIAIVMLVIVSIVSYKSYKKYDNI